MKLIKYFLLIWLGWLIDSVITFFLFGALTAMIAGSGSIFTEQFQIPALWGNIIMATTALLTTMLGINGVISAISFVVPVLLTGVIAVTILTIIQEFPFSITNLQPTLSGKDPVSHWVLSAINYASYNLVIAVAVLSPLGKEGDNQVQLRTGAIWGGLGAGAMSILLALLLNLPQAAEYEIPMIYISGRFNPWIKLIYSGILLAEIYTTAVGNLYGFVVRLTDPDGPRYRIYLVISSFLALIASQFGFSNLVHYLYPAVGYAGLLLLAGLTIGMIKSYKTAN